MQIIQSCKLHTGCVLQNKDFNSCLWSICDTNTWGLLSPIFRTINMVNENLLTPVLLGKNDNRHFINFSSFVWDCNRRGFKLFWVENHGLRFNCWNNKRVWFFWHRCENTGCYDYKPTDLHLAVIESDSSDENNVCDIFFK